MDNPKYHTNCLTIELHADMLKENFNSFYYEIERGYKRAVNLKVGTNNHKYKFIELTLEQDIMLRDTAYEKLEKILSDISSYDIADGEDELRKLAYELGIDSRVSLLNSIGLMNEIIKVINNLPKETKMENDDD